MITCRADIVAISEWLEKKENDPSLAITPGLWFRKGTPAMLVTLIMSSLVFYFFFDFFNKPIH